MKALGIVRNIDGLGRVVIPKEVRRVKGWNEGQPMEMLMDGDNLIIRPYGQDFEKQALVNQIVEVLEHTHNEASKQVLLDTIKFIENK
jgi:AbrB family looped-hinge helix DNA binding protein